MKVTKQFNHFIQRAKERYDLDLTLQDLQEIAETIKSGRAKLTQLDSMSVRYKVRFKSKLMVVVLDREHTTFITVLPLNKYTQSSSFNGKSFYYKDALYMNWLFSKYFDTSRIRCPICGHKHIASDLGQNRFKCLKCFHLVKFGELVYPEVQTSIYDNGITSSALSLSIDLWWQLYLHNDTYTHDNIKIKPILSNEDNFEYTITYRGNSRVIPIGVHLVKDLRRKDK